MDSDSRIYWCALSRVFAYKCAAARALLEHFGSAGAVFEAGRRELSAVLVHGDEYIDRLLNPSLLSWARDEVAWADSEGIILIGQSDWRYPKRLTGCDDAPLMLYYKGTADLNAPRSLAVVGTRKASWYGRDTCRRLVAGLSELQPRPVIVSGLALGIDGTAHLAAIESGLDTIAVLPGGLDDIYPRQHRELARSIVRRGALVTDFPRNTAPVPFTFLRRNRIIAGLSDATLLAESFRKGGGLITASLADSYGRDVFAVPGRVSDVSFEGCNRLIASGGAMLVQDSASLAEVVGWQKPRERKVQEPELFRSGDSPLRREILLTLHRHSPASPEEIAAVLRADPRETALVLLELEMDGRVRSDGTKFLLPL